MAADGDLSSYNARWQEAIGDELLRNVTFAELCRGYGPSDWDRTFKSVRGMLAADGSDLLKASTLRSGLSGAKVLYNYKKQKRSLRKGGYVQLTADDYVY